MQATEPQSEVSRNAQALVISALEFQSLIDTVGPFEGAPHVAVAVSGGADSLCLCLMAMDWARQQGGRVTALMVDHGLRVNSADEVDQVATWLSARGIDHVSLQWRGDKPTTGVQAAAREARYRLMTDWCRDAGVLHLLLGHHGDDQAETYLMRRAHGSGPLGLAGMSAIVERGGVRLLRPLLGTSKARLCATLRSQGQSWIEDPSNQNRAFERVRVRQARAVLPEAGQGTAALLRRTTRFAERRVEHEGEVSAYLAAHCALNPAGFAVLNLPSRADSVSQAAFAQALMCIGARVYPPSPDQLAQAMAKSAGSLARCGWCRHDGGILIWRENRDLPKPVFAVPGSVIDWDDRFKVGVSTAAPSGLTLAPLKDCGWAIVSQHIDSEQKKSIPHRARLSLPALWDGEEVFAVPSMSYIRGGGNSPVDVAFSPPVPLGGLGFSPLA